MTAIQKLQDFLPDHTTAALITSEVNARYFTGFNYTDGAVLITKDTAYLLCDFRYIEAAEKSAREDVTVVQFRRLYEAINEIILQKNIKSLMIEEESVTIATLSSMRSNLSAELLSDCGLSAKIRAIRMIKTSDEIADITRAQRITERALTELLNHVRPGVTERELSVELEHLIHVYGGERIAFELITIAGANTSLPHGVPGDYTVREGDFITFDIGSVYNGYHSDMTRTYAVGHATDKMREIYDIVYQAHLKAAEKIGSLYGCAVLLKGGHSVNDASDLLFDGESSRWFEGRRIDNPNTHGTGCTLSSAIASNLAKGQALDKAVEQAKQYISGALAAMLDLGKGSGPLAHNYMLLS